MRAIERDDDGFTDMTDDTHTYGLSLSLVVCILCVCVYRTVALPQKVVVQMRSANVRNGSHRILYARHTTQLRLNMMHACLWMAR